MVGWKDNQINPTYHRKQSIKLIFGGRGAKITDVESVVHELPALIRTER
jgi:hypothetical protein